MPNDCLARVHDEFGFKPCHIQHFIVRSKTFQNYAQNQKILQWFFVNFSETANSVLGFFWVAHKLSWLYARYPPPYRSFSNLQEWNFQELVGGNHPIPSGRGFEFWTLTALFSKTKAARKMKLLLLKSTFEIL